MDLTRFNALQIQAGWIVTLAQEKLDFITMPPIPVVMLAQALFGLRCESCTFSHLDSDKLGALSTKKRTIYVDTRCSRQQYIFTVAHEIGHWVLHEDKHLFQLNVDNFQSIPLGRIRSTQAKNDKERAELREIEADLFAEALLIPWTFLFIAIKNYEVIDIKAVFELAREFDVLEELMLSRIKNLWKHLAWVGPSIDWDSLDRLEFRLTKYRQRKKQTMSGIQQPNQKAQAGKKPKIVRIINSSVQLTNTKERNPWVRNVVKYLNDLRQNQVVNENTKRPFILEFAGTPNAGKDTLIEIIKNYLEDGYGYRVRVFDEGVKSCYYIDKCQDIHRLYKTVASVVVQLYEARFENPGSCDFVIFNRGLFDRLAFLHTQRACGHISPDQEQIHVNYLLSYSDFQDSTFLFLISPEEAIQRETKPGSKRSFVNELTSSNKPSENKLPEQRIFNTEMLTQLNFSYLYMYQTYKEFFDNQIHLFDFTDRSDATISEKARALADAILPDYSTQLIFPELFGVCYTNGHFQHNQRPKRQQRSWKSSHSLTDQLSFSC